LSLPFHTIGHSTRALGEFTGLLHESEIELLADVRSIPKSRTNPQFNLETLPESLGAQGIAYAHIASLGGRRGKRASDDPSPNGYWTHPAFRNYADYALGDAFGEGLSALLDLGHRQRCAIMCSEAVWWRCHRRIVADYLLARGETVLHIMAPHQVKPASLTPGAVVQPDGHVVYPAEA
jgi:uncharacterized protein (DUF488 family)